MTYSMTSFLLNIKTKATLLRTALQGFSETISLILDAAKCRQAQPSPTEAVFAVGGTDLGQSMAAGPSPPPHPLASLPQFPSLSPSHHSQSPASAQSIPHPVPTALCSALYQLLILPGVHLFMTPFLFPEEIYADFISCSLTAAA